MSEQRSNRISSGVIAAVSAAVVAVSGGVALFTWNSSQPPTTDNTSQNTQQPSPGSTNQPSQEQAARVFWLKDNGNNLELVPQTLKLTDKEPNQALTQAFQALLAGPTEGTDSTTIPKGTKLLSLKQESDTIHINLSPEFTSGGGSSSMMGRLGQVLFTATSLNPDAKVYIEVNGEKLDVLGGEGVEVEQPMTRKIFQQNYPL
ncbi:MAG: GerMN domain-containing protein [Calothrix sp. MO_167.B12]|nr:GerMN domain-containing protein [Calothrix sp. MO_167.B12]